jgi:hypothetical protein
MKDRLLKLLDPDELDASQRTAGWIAGELVGAIVAAAALALALTYLV